ncbi:MAG: hypothetical protein LC130_14200 [Bryobacterales bacterium]|nr:hypothetical protein [Bryobacterales bacterium]
MATPTAEAPTGSNEGKQASVKPKERGRRRRGVRIDAGSARYFLVKMSGSDKIELAEEAASESEAMVTAFRTGASFAVVTEWRTTADLTSGQPVIKKEAIAMQKK